MTTPSMIETRGLTHRYGNGNAGIYDISIRIPEGTFIILAGANGSGKTTFLKHLNGLLRPSAGEVRVGGRRVGKDTRWVRQRVGMVFQDADTQIVGETVAADVAFGPENLRLSRDEIDRRVKQALDITGLAALAPRRPHTLSGGEKRRLAIAGVLAMEPRVILLDEPFANLDWPGTREILSQILQLHEKGHTLVAATHDIEKIIAHADRLVVLADGRVALDGDPAVLADQVEPFGVRAPCAVRFGKEISSWPA